MEKNLLLKTTHIKEEDKTFIRLSALLFRKKICWKKDEFLSRDINKQRLINLIGKIGQKGCAVFNAERDADVDIVRSAVDAYSTTLIGEDTDLLVLLLYYAQEVGKGLYFKSDKPKSDV